MTDPGEKAKAYRTAKKAYNALCLAGQELSFSPEESKALLTLRRGLHEAMDNSSIAAFVQYAEGQGLKVPSDIGDHNILNIIKFVKGCL